MYKIHGSTGGNNIEQNVSRYFSFLQQEEIELLEEQVNKFCNMHLPCFALHCLECMHMYMCNFYHSLHACTLQFYQLVKSIYSQSTK